MDMPHQFAFYLPNISKNSKLTIYEITEQDLIHRIKTVLRLKVNEKIILFDENVHANSVIVNIDSKSKILVKIEHIDTNQPQEIEITWLLPILKREAFEDAIYSLAEIGVNNIQPITTEKAHRAFASEKDIIRLKKIIIAACEQSKNFNIPNLLPILSLQDVVKNNNKDSYKIFFDSTGTNLDQAFTQLKKEKTVVAISGPEADLSLDEKKFLEIQGYNFYRLTKTILRAQQAVTLGAGFLRLIN